jgi:hypothetical protein
MTSPRQITLEDSRPMALDLAYDLLGWSDAIESEPISFEDYQERGEENRAAA